MISSVDIKRNYMILYSDLRKYFWDYFFVEALVDLEDAVLKKFPNMTDVRRLFNRVYNMALPVIREDEELERRMKEFKSLIEQNDCEFSYIKVNVKE